MNANIHRHGQRYPVDELIERATGESPTADYVEEKFGERYGI